MKRGALLRKLIFSPRDSWRSCWHLILSADVIYCSHENLHISNHISSLVLTHQLQSSQCDHVRHTTNDDWGTRLCVRERYFVIDFLTFMLFFYSRSSSEIFVCKSVPCTWITACAWRFNEAHWSSGKVELRFCQNACSINFCLWLCVINLLSDALLAVNYLKWLLQVITVNLSTSLHCRKIVCIQCCHFSEYTCWSI